MEVVCTYAALHDIHALEEALGADERTRATIDPACVNYVAGQNGSVVRIPANALTDADGSEILAVTGKDSPRVAAILQRGTLVSGATRFRWAAIEAGASEVEVLLAAFPDSDPARAFAADRCQSAVLTGRRPIEISREAGLRKPLLRRSTFWDALMQAAAAGPLHDCEYSYRRRADRYRLELTPPERARLHAAARSPTLPPPAPPLWPWALSRRSATSWPAGPGTPMRASSGAACYAPSSSAEP